MSSIEVVEARCPQNHRCPVIGVCPTQAISQESSYSAPKIDKSLCTDCGLCVRFCGYGAFQKR